VEPANQASILKKSRISLYIVTDLERRWCVIPATDMVSGPEQACLQPTKGCRKKWAAIEEKFKAKNAKFE